MFSILVQKQIIKNVFIILIIIELTYNLPITTTATYNPNNKKSDKLNQYYDKNVDSKNFLVNNINEKLNRKIRWHRSVPDLNIKLLKTTDTSTASTTVEGHDDGENFIQQIISELEEGQNHHYFYYGIYENFNPALADNFFPPECILGGAELYLWWINIDGSFTDILTENCLDFSNVLRSEYTLYEDMVRFEKHNPIITRLTLANNGLPRVPKSALSIINDTLEYLSLTGNLFVSKIILDSGEEIPNMWSSFPKLYNLQELDMRNCSITYLSADAFNNIPYLEKLYLAYNQFVQIEATIFLAMPNLVHLDMSYNNSTQIYDSIMSMDALSRIVEGLHLPETAFRNLTKLRFLDFSHTRITSKSVKSFIHLGKSLEQMSLCYTGLSIIAGEIFNATNLKVLDVSGNPSTSPLLQKDSFHGLENSLQILSYEYSNIKYLHWLPYLTSLKILKLKGNNINQLTNDTLVHLPNIEIIDFSSNHISNWYHRVFSHNNRLKILNLRDNNINIMTTEMFNDFSPLEFLAIGKNNFVCNCILREFIDVASINNRNINYTNYVKDIPSVKEVIREFVVDNYNKSVGFGNVKQPEYEQMQTNANHYDVLSRIYMDYISRVGRSYWNMRETINSTGILSRVFHFTVKHVNLMSDVLPCNESLTEGTITTPCDHEINNFSEAVSLEMETLNFTFQILDYDNNEYRCINSTTNKDYYFSDIEQCIDERNILQDLNNLKETGNAIATILIVIFVCVLILTVIFFKWFYIRYFCLIIKNATILSFLDKNNNNRTEINDIEGTYVYDVFVSYCDENREWVLDELLPNIEQQREINVCLHERDFQVGISILDNIISCMDRSRCLLLIVSNSFLLSQWCQFEMHLAQHRLLETRRDELILVLLEDIPKRKQPKTLTYLMRTKTYIKWPNNIKSPDRSIHEERKIFWKRLQRALITNEPNDNLQSSAA